MQSVDAPPCALLQQWVHESPLLAALGAPFFTVLGGVSVLQGHPVVGVIYGVASFGLGLIACFPSGAVSRGLMRGDYVPATPRFAAEVLAGICDGMHESGGQLSMREAARAVSGIALMAMAGISFCWGAPFWGTGLALMSLQIVPSNWWAVRMISGQSVEDRAAECYQLGRRQAEIICALMPR